MLTICTAEVALNLPTTRFLFVLRDHFPAARAIKPHLHASFSFFRNRSIAMKMPLASIQMDPFTVHAIKVSQATALPAQVTCLLL